MKLFTREKQAGSDVVKLLASCSELSTKTLLEVSMRDPKYRLEFAKDDSTFLHSVKMSAHDIYIIDTSAAKGESKFSLIKQLETLKKKGKTRVIILVDERPPDGADRMESFGALCFLECFFTVDRFMDALNRAVALKDTGCRVKGDDRFFNIAYFSKSK